MLAVKRSCPHVYIALMSQRPIPSTVQSVDALRLQMERSIDELAELARGDVEGGQFFAEVLKRALEPGSAVYGVLWRRSQSGAWEPAGEMPISSAPDVRHLEERQELLNEIALSSQPRVIGPTPGSNSHATEDSQVFSPLRHAGQTVGILETRHASPSLPPATFQFFAAVGEITADFLSQQELQQLRHAKMTWLQWDQFSQHLGQSLELADVCAVIANDGRQLLACDRISVLVRVGSSYRLQAASGVERVNPRAGAVRSLESLAALVAELKQPVWQSAGNIDSAPEGATLGRLNESLGRHLQESGAVCFGAIPLESTDPGSSPAAILTFEHFQPVADWPGGKSRAASLVERSTPIVCAAIERNAIPWRGLWLSIQQGPRFLRRPATVLGIVVLGIVIGALALIPAEFTVTGHAELWPQRRRDVFASTSGIVDRILVDHGDDVKENQELIVLRDPELEQDVPRMAGEIATTTERLRSVQIARLTGGVAPDAVSRARQLTAEEEELKERLKTMERQRLLIEERRQRLTLRSPIAGRVLTWDTAQHLSARPVERGQSLLTIGETNGPWIVEIHVADKDAGYMLRAQKTLGTALDVDFLLPSEPGRTHRGKVYDVALASESNDRSSGHVRVLVEFDSAQVEQLRPGATAIPRIRCGRWSLGYVWLHDLIDAIRIQLLF